MPVTQPYLEVTTAAGCSNACSFCPQRLTLLRSRELHSPLMMTYEVFKECVDKVPKTVRIGFGGLSEPFQNLRCLDMIAYVKKKGHEVTVYSTLARLTEDGAVRLFKLLSLSEDGTDKLIIHVSSDEMIERIPVTPTAIRVMEIAVQRLTPNVSFHFHGKSVHAKLRPVLQKVGVEYQPIHTRAGLNPMLRGRKVKRLRGRLSCPLHLISNILTPSGDVLVCCQDFGMKHIIGNLRKDSYASLFSSPGMMVVKKGLEDERVDTLCRTCDWAISENATAHFYNASKLRDRVVMGAKIGLYRTSPKLYRLCRSFLGSDAGASDEELKRFYS